MDSILAAKQILENYDARVPINSDRVYKDECLYSFDSPVSIIIIIITFIYILSLLKCLYEIYIKNSIHLFC